MLGAEIVGVLVEGHDLGVHIENALQVFDGLLKKLVGLQVFQIPDVLADKGPVLLAQANGVFQLGPQRQSGRDGLVDKDRHRARSRVSGG